MDSIEGKRPDDTVFVREHYASGSERQELLDEAGRLPAWCLTQRQRCDLELILNGGFTPLDGFLSRADYESVIRSMRLASGKLWPIPVVLDVDQSFADRLTTGQRITLTDEEGVPIALMTIRDLWIPSREEEAQLVYRTTDPHHSGVEYLLERTHPVYIGGPVTGIGVPTHYDFKHLRLDPNDLRRQFAVRSWRRIVAFQTRNPMHRAHMELTFRAARQAEANLLIHPSVGMTKPGDIDHFTRVRCYEHLVSRYPEQTTMLALLPLAMRMGGPREAVWHAIIRRNYGATHFIVGRDHAGPGKGADGNPFYGPYEAQELVAQHGEEIGIEMLPFQQMVYVRDRAQYLPFNEVKSDETVLDISGTEFRRRLTQGLDIPEWFSFPEVVAELRRTHPPLSERGFVVFFTGLSGSGKSTMANALMVKLLELGGRRVTLLDGDIVRRNLSSELGFSKEHRDLNIQRIGFVAAEIAKHGGIALCAPIAPYEATRRNVREMVESGGGGFIEVYVSTPLAVCEDRDRKGLYARARRGELKEFTGISDPYEVPANPEVNIDTQKATPEQAAQQLMLKLESLGYIS